VIFKLPNERDEFYDKFLRVKYDYEKYRDKIQEDRAGWEKKEIDLTKAILI